MLISVLHCRFGENSRASQERYTVKAVLSSQGAYLISDLPEGGLK